MKVIQASEITKPKTNRFFLSMSSPQYQKFLQVLSQNEMVDLFITRHYSTDALCIYDLLTLSKTPVRTFFLGNPELIDTVILSGGTAGRYVLPNCVLSIRPLAPKHDFSKTDLFLEANVRSVCEKVSNTNRKLADILAKKTGKTLAEIQDRMNNNPYFTAEEAVEFGLIDGIVTDLSMILSEDNES